MQKNQN